MKILRRIGKEEFHDFLNSKINLDDKSLYKEVCESQQFIFQCSGNTCSRMIREALPENFDDLCAINATSRPGASGMFPDFVAAKNYGKQKYPDQIDKLLKDTRGCVLYQEQIMSLFGNIAGYSGEQTNVIRGILKKLGKSNPKQADIDEWNNVHVPAFKAGCERLGIPDSEIEKIIKDVVQLSKYSFNKSHAVAYSYIAMMTVYLSRYFRNYYYAASLTYDAEKKDVLKESIGKVEKRGYRILPPDVNSSNVHFSPDETNILFGLNDIKGVGEQPAKDIIENRPYSSVIDFVIKTLGTSVNKRVTTALICSGAFDGLIENNRSYYSRVTEDFYKRKKSIKTPALLEEKWAESMAEVEKIDNLEEECVQWEDEYLGGQFFHTKFTVVADKIEKLYSKGYCLRDFAEVREKKLTKQYVFVYVNKYRTHIDKKGQEMLFMSIEDRNGEKIDVPIFASYWKYCKEKFEGNGFYLMDFYPTAEGGIMFGSSKWITDGNVIRSMMAKVPNV